MSPASRERERKEEREGEREKQGEEGREGEGTIGEFELATVKLARVIWIFFQSVYTLNI